MSIFSKINLKRPQTSTFNLSHDRKMSFNMGDLVPMLCQPVIPGDTFNVTTQQVLRLAPMISPMMHDVNVFTHFYFVPNRLLNNKWEQFITGGENGLDTTIPPLLRNFEVPIGGLLDHLGFPEITDSAEIEANMLPILAYNLIYDEYYRDQNLIDSYNWDSLKDQNGALTPNQWNASAVKQDFFDLKKRAWSHDYFTSALPFAQKGNPVRIPIAGEADVNFIPRQLSNGTTIYKQTGGGYNDPLSPTVSNEGLRHDGAVLESDESNPLYLDNSANLKVDLDQATSTTINDLRTAVKIQEWLEKNARAGSRYIESILAHFGVQGDDARLQRPEFLGGGKSPVLISEVLQTSQSDQTPLAEMAGHGLNLGKNHSFKKYFKEHGFIIGIVSVIPKASYQQGIPREFLKKDKFDYFWPEFQHIGEQAIWNAEIFHSPSDLQNYEEFGYIPRNAEYKFIPSSVHGDFKDTLDFWHMGRIFTTRPTLSAKFIESDPTTRIFAVEDPGTDKLYCQMWHNITAKRPMSYFSDPSFR